ncbi:MAG: fumarylacetoacetate hydrolase family protein, partial [Bacillota bacterium]|nr:fumarylacetoacetate hydrolase family protein [Bacillota bacterium]
SVEDPYNLPITCQIFRDGQEVFKGEANTGQLKRTFDELVAYLGKCNDIFSYTVLLTGTCVVPGDDFTLKHGDEVHITIADIGTLKNRMVLIED